MLKFSAVIVTRNRCKEACQALDSIIKQINIAECIVVVDASEDETASVIEEKYSEVTLIVNDERKGVSFSRNLAIEKASNEYILQIDDDAVLTTPNIAIDIMKQFTDKRFAAIAIPFINIKQSKKLFHKSPDYSKTFVAYTYVGTAVMLKRSIFLKLGGYSLELEHWGEERDYTLRLLDAGFFVVYGISDPIHHFTSASRDMKYQNIYLYRNQLFFGFLRAPLLYLPVFCTWALIWSAVNAIRSKNIIWGISGLFQGFLACLKYKSARSPIRISNFKLALKLRKKCGLPLTEVEDWIKKHG